MGGNESPKEETDFAKVILRLHCTDGMVDPGVSGYLAAMHSHL